MKAILWPMQASASSNMELDMEAPVLNGMEPDMEVSVSDDMME